MRARFELVNPHVFKSMFLYWHDDSCFLLFGMWITYQSPVLSTAHDISKIVMFDALQVMPTPARCQNIMPQTEHCVAHCTSRELCAPLPCRANYVTIWTKHAKCTRARTQHYAVPVPTVQTNSLHSRIGRREHYGGGIRLLARKCARLQTAVVENNTWSE